MLRAVSFILDLASWAFIAIFVILLLLSLGSNTQLLRGYNFFVIQSASMEPTIRIGDVILVHKKPYYSINDVITFKNKTNRIVTHRIIKKEKRGDEYIFLTKGDANRSIDEDSITEEQIIGALVLVIPKIGFLASFAKTTPGFLALIIFPATILLLDQAIKTFGRKNV